jgi:hypothetical protein
MEKQSTLKIEVSIPSEVAADLVALIMNQNRILDRLDRLQSLVIGNGEKIMTLVADFEAFKTAVNQGLDTINTELQEIQTDIERLAAAAADTPQEVLDGMNAIKDRITALADRTQAISDIDNPPEPETPPETPPEEPPL